MMQVKALGDWVFFRGAGGLKKETKAQSTLEYAVIIVCLVAALLAIQIYVKRAMQGRFRQAADEMGPQYAPRNTTGTSTVTSHSPTTSTSITYSEQDLYDICLENGGTIEDCEDKANINGRNGIEDNVYTTKTETRLGEWDDQGNIIDYEETTQTGDETIGPLENSLY